MIERIIALRGRGEIGKSTTIILLADELINRSWRRESRVLHGNGIDITDVYTNEKGVRLGVASAGDNFREVDGSLRLLFTANCSVVICACRTRGATHTAMRQFTNNVRFVNKSIFVQGNRVQREAVNTRDINTILNILNS